LADDQRSPGRPIYRNPFIWAFLVGVVALTLLPMLQRGFLRAPPPIQQLEPFSLPSSDGSRVTEGTLRGKVWVAQVLPEKCTPECLARVDRLGRLLPHLTNAAGPVVLMSVVVARAGMGVSPELGAHAVPGRWLFVSGTPEEVAPLVTRGLWHAVSSWSITDAGSTLGDFTKLPMLALVDQNGAVRGFWPDDAPGRGNIINAARLLARYGPRP
jgi:cytochrome oxidase Cu insertion factor (SCO1/SenC/PrrC family)